MTVRIVKSAHRLTVTDEAGAVIFACAAGFGRAQGPKRREGDLRTPEGEYYVCLKKHGKYGPSLGLSYPSPADAALGVSAGVISDALLPLFTAAQQTRARPPWGTALGGEIYIHAGGSAEDWTAGCIALNDDDMARLFDLCEPGTEVIIQP